jgi:alkylated DNA repair dioxygenase AlkB
MSPSNYSLFAPHNTEQDQSNNLLRPLTTADILLDGALSCYWQALTNADVLLQQLRQEIPWASQTLTVYGKTHIIPRLECWQGEPRLHYTYSGKTLSPHPWHPLLQQLASELNQQLGRRFNSVLCNLYRNGEDGMGWHADDEPELGPEPVIASITLGATRDFALRRKGETRQWGTLPLPHGSLLLMNAGMQTHWQHAIPKRAGVSAERINLTFRELQR